MLRLEKLELVGFKSFADKLEVEFNDRVTAVVGPNGCGKSNLFDALGWVLGSQSPRFLRGDKMEDVIFSGSKKRKVSGVAEVSLTLCRPGGQTVSIDGTESEGETVEIRRKLYRSGESHYLINQRRCRLKDIQKVMEDLGLGYATYALIPQGRIDSFLTGRPSDRRAVIEEAARILSYKSRRRSAELKLEMAQQNLSRVNDIISEVERSLRSLKRQAAKARRYREVKAEFRRVQLQRFKLESQSLEQKLSRCESQLEELRQRQATLDESLTEAQRLYRSTSQQRDRLEEELNQLQKDRSEMALETDRVQGSIRHHREQIDSISRYLETSKAEQQVISKSLEKVESELQAFKLEEQEIQAEHGRVSEQESQHGRKVDEHSRELARLEGRIEELTEGQIQLSARKASLENLEAQLQNRLEEFLEQQERQEVELQEGRLRIEDAEERLAQRREQFRQEQEAIEELRQRLEETQQQSRDLQSQLHQSQQDRKENHERLIALRERLQSLQEVQLSHSQYSEGVRKFLNHLSSSRTIRARGTLADQLETESRYENLVEGFLDEELEFVLVESMQEALQGLSEVKNLKSGKCTFLTLYPNGFGHFDSPSPTDLGELAREEGVLGPLRSLLHMEPDVESAFFRVLPQQAEAVVVSDLGRALHLAHSYPHTTFVTLEGETLSPRGLLGASAQDAKKLGLLSLKRQKKQLEEKIAALAKTDRELGQRESQLQARQAGLDEALRESQSEIYRLEKSSLSSQHQIDQLTADSSRHTQAFQQARQRLEALQQDRRRAQERLEETAQERQQLESENRRSETAIEQARESLKQIRIESERMQQHLHSLSSSRQVLEERRAALERTLQRVLDQQQGLQERLSESLESSRRSRQAVQQRRQEVEELEGKLTQLETESSSAAARLEERQRDYADSRQALPALEERVGALSQEKSELQEVLSQWHVDRARWETQLQNIAQQCLQQLQVPLQEALREVVADQPLEEVVQRYERLRSRLDSFGPINMTALQEYQESEERHQFLTGQRQDIEASIADTQRAIQDLNRRSRQQFQEAFEAVNRHFQEFFQRLFGGGECGMRLLDEEDLLESGIDIFAQPPGKRLQNVMLLSGGEKALTVLALLMGLFAYRPSQFCVLDEVDAPLDDANIIRFTTLIREMSEKTQLILITHNKRTMQVADALYGITMSEPGISEMVSVQLT